MDRFQMPTVADQFRSQPIEQFGMAGSIAVVPEIIWCFHDALAEVMLPKAIHQNAGGEGLLRIDQPLSQTCSRLHDIRRKFRRFVGNQYA